MTDDIEDAEWEEVHEPQASATTRTSRITAVDREMRADFITAMARDLKHIGMWLFFIFICLIVIAMMNPNDPTRDNGATSDTSAHGDGTRAITPVVKSGKVPPAATSSEDSAEPVAEPAIDSALAPDTGFERFQVSMYSGPTAPLKLSGDDQVFRTRFKKIYADPINFGGSMVVEGIGCGTECVFYAILDKSRGKSLAFPLGGENNLSLYLNVRPNSALIWASWKRYDLEGDGQSTCVAQPWVLGNKGFLSLAEPVQVSCDDEGMGS